MSEFSNPVYCALDTTDKDRAVAIAQAVKGSVGGLKIGLETFYSLGHDGYDAVAAFGLPIFLDLKLHDIPNTVAGGIRALLPLRPSIINVHASGGMAMMSAAMEAAKRAGDRRPKIIGVTVLTSLDDDDLAAAGVSRPAHEQALRLAVLSQKAGLDGVVCSAHDIAAIKSECGPDFLTVVPGIRPASSSIDDQKRAMTPEEALAQGADILVVGRPITANDAPGDAADAIARSLAA